MPKKPISATIDKRLVSWIEAELKNPLYRNKSHLIEIALQEYRKAKQNGKGKTH